MNNYYQILGVSENATTAEIKSAYKSLAKIYHPDINPSPAAEEHFKLISVAYKMLSNSEYRFQHDHQLARERLKRAQFASQNYQKRQERPWSKPQQHYSNRPTGKRISPEMERKGTIYAIAMVGAVAFIIYIGVTIFEFYQTQKLERVVENFNNQVQYADSLYYAGKIKAALLYISDIKSSSQTVAQLKAYEINYLNFRQQQADIDYKNNAFQDALWGYLFYMEYTGRQDVEMLYRAANCYRKVGQPANAVFILNNLMNQDFKLLEMMELLATIYKEDMEDKELALKYYEMGLLTIRQQFKEIYGEAYRLLVSAERTPTTYKKIYFGAAELYYLKRDYVEASKLLEWVIFFEPQKEKAYQYLINCYLEMEKELEACQVSRKANNKNIEISNSQLINCL